jgi:BirA family biotin operon repressor/biotin-[acetyl-CoA-carboxylase] ligase
LQQVLEQLYRDKASIEADYEKALYKRGEKVKLRKGSRVFETLIEGVSSDGELITNNGMEQRFEVGEVEWII